MKSCLKYLLCAVLLWGTNAGAQIPRTISFQGLLTSSPGVPVPNGSYSLKFELYNAPSGGTLRHSETHSGVAITQGTFGVVLGPLPAVFTESLYVQVTALSGPPIGSPLTFSPRTPLTSAPYALAPWAPNDTNVSYTGGNVGIGTSSPAYRLHVLTASEGISLQGTSGSVDNTAYMSFRNGAGTRLGYVGDGSVGDDDIFLSADQGNIDLSTSAGRVLTATSSGDIGIGTTSPGERLTVAGSMEVGTGAGDYQHIRLGGGNSSGFIYGSYPKFNDGLQLGYNYYADHNGNDVVANTGGGTSRLTLGYGDIGLYTGGINSVPSNLALYAVNGRIGIGTTSPNYLLHCYAYNFTPAKFETIYGSDAMVATNDGTGGTYHTAVYGEAAATTGYYNNGIYGYAAGGTYNYGVYASGDLGYTGSLVHPSDEKFKENIRAVDDVLPQIMSLPTRTFSFKSGKEYERLSFSKGMHYGFIAQELEKVFPDLVVPALVPPRTDEKGKPIEEPIEYKGVKMMEMIPILTRAIQEQQQLIENLEAKVEQLEKK